MLQAGLLQALHGTSNQVRTVPPGFTVLLFACHCSLSLAFVIVVAYLKIFFLHCENQMVSSIKYETDP